tara:strand:- start:6504 stop:6809 length:306 start_codon:yes stop_codon:yes gene_type:complete
MFNINKFHTILPTMVQVAQKSDIRYQLSAALIKGNKFVMTPTHNTNGEKCRGCHCGSLHAEHRVLLKAYPDLQYRKGQWCFLQSKRKGPKFKKGQEKSYQG